MDWQIWLWVIVTIALVVLELATVQLVSIWFAIAALAAMVAAIFHLDMLWQVIIFIVVSCIMFLLLKPIAKRRLLKGQVPTNSDAIIGKKCLVIQEVDENGGRVQVANQDWAARCRENMNFPVGGHGLIQSIEGVTLIIVPLNKEV